MTNRFEYEEFSDGEFEISATQSKQELINNLKQAAAYCRNNSNSGYYYEASPRSWHDLSVLLILAKDFLEKRYGYKMKRFDFDYPGDGSEYLELIESEDGDYVLYSDVEKLIEENDILRLRIKQLKEDTKTNE
jgi:hypothetical protein